MRYSTGTSQFFPFHNHDDYKATNNGVYPGGMFTMIMPLPYRRRHWLMRQPMARLPATASSGYKVG